MSQLIKLEQFKDGEVFHELAVSYGRVSCKSLKIVTNVISKEVKYVVEEHNRVVLATENFNLAIEEYNSLN